MMQMDSKMRALALKRAIEKLQFETLPTAEEVHERYRQLSKSSHPDCGGSDEMFKQLTDAKNNALIFLKGGEGE